MDPTLILIVAVVSVAIGYAAGAIITLSRSGKKADEGTPAVKPSEPAKEAQHAPVQALPPANPNRVEVVTLWRELPQGALRADMGDKTVKKTSDLTSEQSGQLRTVMSDLRDWLGIAPSSPAAGAPLSPGPAVSVGYTIAAVSDPLVSGGSISSESNPVLGENMDLSAAADAISARMAAVSQPVFEPKPPAEAATAKVEKKSGEIPSQPITTPVENKPSQSIVAQIDDILQAQIKGTPLESRGIRLTESPTHGVTVWIGVKPYQGMDTIPDAAVNAAIRAAVKQWEANK